MTTLQIVAQNPQLPPEFVDPLNPLLEDPRIRFAEYIFGLYEQEFGEEGNVVGFLKLIEQWSKLAAPDAQ